MGALYNAHSPIYDIAGRVKQIKLKKQGENIKTYVSDISYNPKGQRTSITYGNGVVTSYSYDSKTFRLTKLESKKEQKKLQSINYTYDPIGNITTMDDESYKTIFPNNKSIDTKSDYHYDSLYRLVQATGKEHPALSGKEEVITPIPHLNNQNAISNYTEYYDFDYGSNITKIRHNGKNSSTNEFYISNKSNHSLPIIDRRSVNESNIDENYDERGNLLKLHGSQNLHWNYRDNIAYVDIITRPSGKNDSEYYVYDSSGQRVRKVTETYQNNEASHTKVEKTYLGDIEVTRTYQNNSLSKEKYIVHVMDDKSRVALHHYWTKGTSDETRESQSRYQLSNHLDSVALELNDNAEIITYEEYLPFGGTALIAGKTVREVTEKEYRYSGKERDESTGLYYYGARYYAPWLLRWINPDPAGTIDGLNLYQFVGGNPINSVDLFGLMKPGANTRSKKSDKQSEPLQPLKRDYQNHEWNDLQEPWNLDKGWRVNANRGDTAELLNSGENRLLQHISEGVDLALGKIKNKLGPELCNQITPDIFKVTKFDVVRYSKMDEKGFENISAVIFPVELKASINILVTGQENDQVVGNYNLNINIDNPTGGEGPHGPHVGAEITATGKADNKKDLHAHILLKPMTVQELQGLEAMPGRDRADSNRKHDTLEDAIRHANAKEPTIITQGNLFSPGDVKLNKVKGFSHHTREVKKTKLTKAIGLFGERAKGFLEILKGQNIRILKNNT